MGMNSMKSSGTLNTSIQSFKHYKLKRSRAITVAMQHMGMYNLILVVLLSTSIFVLRAYTLKVSIRSFFCALCIYKSYSHNSKTF